MPLFKFRKGAEQTANPTDTVETLRARARHRLIGSAVLVLLGVVGFPLLFDTQPRPVQVDVPIDIPAKNEARPLTLPGAPAPAAAVNPPAPTTPPPSATPSAPPPQAPAPASSPAVAGAPSLITAPAPALTPVSAPRATASPARNESPRAEAAASASSPPATAAGDDGQRAQALLEGKAAAATGNERYIVQFGAYEDPERAREARLKVERTGLKTYTHIAETKDGKRIRTRVGPFATRAEADKAADKIKALGLPVSVLTL